MSSNPATVFALLFAAVVRARAEGRLMLAAARQTMWGGGAPTAADYISDGLIGLYDGIENDGWGAHSSTRTTWRELIAGSVNPAIKSRTWGDSYLTNVFDDASYTSTQYYKNRINGNITIELVLLVNSVNNSATSSSSANLNSGFSVSGSTWIGIGLNRAYFGMGSDTTYAKYAPVNYSAFYGTGKSFVISCTAGGGTAKSYLNGVLKNTQAMSGFTTLSNTYFSLGGGPWGSNKGFNGRHYCIRIYNRALTAGEIAKNFAIDKERFGL